MSNYIIIENIENSNKLNKGVVNINLIDLNSLKTRLILVLIGIVFLTSLIINIFVIPTISNSIYQEKESQVRMLINSALGVLEHYHSLAQEGILSKEEAQNRAKEQIKNLTYGANNQDYFWINNYQPKMIMHPFKLGLNGQDISGVEDPDGVNLFVEMAEVVKEKGSGYVEYKWQYYDEEGRIEPKISYVKGFDPWGWILGTGVYTNDVQEKVVAVRNKVILLTVVILLLAGGLAYFLSNYFSQPIEELTGTASRVAKGDLTESINIDRKDEVGKLAKALNNMIEDLRGIVEGIHESVDETSSASMELAASSQETASSIEKVAHSAEDFNQTVKQVAENTSEVANLGDEVDQLAHKGLDQMDTTQKEMTGIIKTSTESTQIINELETSANEIEKIIGVISDISEQTNLLALNASIEAARAGTGCKDSGQGFAVVAEEIRELAERTQDSVDNIKEIINQLQAKTGQAVEIIEENNIKIESGAKTLEQTGELFREIVDKIDRVIIQVQNIAEFSDELLTTSDGISGETQDQSAAMQEIAGASEELTAMSDQLEELINQFKIKLRIKFFTINILFRNRKCSSKDRF